MKKIVLCCAITLFSFGVYAQIIPQPTTLPIQVGIELADMAKVSKLEDVYFGGAYIPENTDVTLTMDNRGVVRISGGSTTLYNQLHHTLGRISIAANKEASFKITAPESVNLKNQESHAGDVQVPDLVYRPVFFDLSGSAIDVTTAKQGFDSSLYGTIRIGGSLVVPRTSYRGMYAGTMNITVSWL